jgi:prophage regulatory protein
MSQQIQVNRRPEVERRTGQGRSSIYAAIADGLFPPPVKIGARAVGWISHEVDAINAARAAGKTQDEIKDLVKRLVADRAKLRA